MQSNQASRAQARRGLLLIMLAAVLWGTVGITTKTIYGLTATNPLSIGFFRLALSLPPLFIISWQRQGKALFRVAGPDLLLMMLIGAMTALYQVCYFGAIERTGVAVATLVTLCTAPVLVSLISVALTRHRPSGHVLAALTGALAGTALLVVYQETAGVQGADAGGVLLALGSALGYALVALCTQRLAGRYDPFQSIAISFSIGALILFLVARAHGLVLSYPPVCRSLLVYLGVVPTALAYVLFIAGMRSTSATVASISTLLEPLVATLLAWVIFGERFSPLGFVGVALLSGSLLLLYLGGSAGLRKAARAG